MTRESVYTCGYLGIFPFLNEKLSQNDSLPSGAPFMIAGVTAGLTAAILTHPSDTIKTRMQANIDPEATPQYRNQLASLRQLLSEGGVGALYAGFLPRAVRLVGEPEERRAADRNIQRENKIWCREFSLLS